MYNGRAGTLGYPGSILKCKKLALAVNHIGLPQNQFLNQLMAVGCRHSDIRIYRFQRNRSDIINMPLSAAFVIAGKRLNPNIVTICCHFLI